MKKYLNRDGLEEYNSLLPHSSGEMQEYVNDWLDEHPEATTTVQDGAITEPKLADKSVSLRTLADDTVHMLNGMILTREISGDILTADDAYSAPPVALTVEGKSTQDGTPTPDAPVEIISVEQVGLCFAGKNLLPNDRFCAGNYNRPAGYVFNPNASTISTLVDNGDGTFALNVASAWGGLSMYTAPLPAGTYHMHIGFSGLAPRVSFGYVDASTMQYVAHTKNYTSSGTLDNTVTLDRPVIIVISLQSSTADTITITQPQVNIGSTAITYQPYESASVLLNLTHALRSLPNGTKDTLALTYLRPSTREGWAWYSRELVQRVLNANFDNLAWTRGNLLNDGTGRVFRSSSIDPNAIAESAACMCDHLTMKRNNMVWENMAAGEGVFITKMLVIAWPDADATVTEVKSAVSDYEFLYGTTAPTTTQLDPIELPVLPAPDVTVWSDPSTGLQMEYVRDTNIVIQNIEQAIADQ